MKLFKLLTGALAALAMTAAVNAVPYEILVADWSVGSEPSPFTGLYKSNVDDGDEGSAIFETEFGEDPNDPKEWAKITWTNGYIPVLTGIYLKAGTESFFHSLVGVDFSFYTSIWAYNPTTNNNAISHVSLYGGTTSVPDGASTAALLGLGLVGLSFIARRRKA
jgi:hypothetical protein